MGLGALGLGIAGVAIPLLPTVPFILLAAFCFARSDPAWEEWLLTHPRFGPLVTEWRERGAIGRRAKVIGITAFVLSGGAGFFVLNGALSLVPLAVALGGAIWIATRPAGDA